MKSNHQNYLNLYLNTLTAQERQAIPQTEAYYFCADEYNANECARLVDLGIKQASCGLKAAYDIDNEPYMQVGALVVVLNWKEEPVCIIKITSVSICPFNQVTAEFARLEGEGDLSYDFWHKAHFNFFTTYAKQVGVEFTKESDLVLETFKKVYPL